LTLDKFYSLAKPTEDPTVRFFSSTTDELYPTIVMHYMAHPSIPVQQKETSEIMQNMEGE
jgi:hypothetical protein